MLQIFKWIALTPFMKLGISICVFRVWVYTNHIKIETWFASQTQCKDTFTNNKLFTRIIIIQAVLLFHYEYQYSHISRALYDIYTDNLLYKIYNFNFVIKTSFTRDGRLIVDNIDKVISKMHVYTQRVKNVCVTVFRNPLRHRKIKLRIQIESCINSLMDMKG